MDQQKYQVVFNSTGIAKTDLETIKQNFAVLFKQDMTIIGHLFADRPVILKKHLNWATAERYQVAILKAGAQCSIEPEGDLGSNRVAAQITIIRCPFCNNMIQDEADKCVHCGTDIKSYIDGFKAKGRVFIKGVGIVNDRRKFNRRVSPDPRVAIRFEDDRRIVNDRRVENQSWAGEL